MVTKKYLEKKFDELKKDFYTALDYITQHITVKHPVELENHRLQLAQRNALVDENNLLVHALCEKYNKGTMIICDGDEMNVKKVIRNGQSINVDNIKSLKFVWDDETGIELTMIMK